MKRLLLVALALVCTSHLWAQTSDRDIFQQAESRFRAGDYEIALDRYETLIRQHPVSQLVPDAQFRRAVVLYRLQRYQESLELLQRVETRFRSTRFLQQVPFWKGVVNYRLGGYQVARREFERFLEADAAPAQRSQALLYLALSEVALGDRQRAIAALEEFFDVSAMQEESYALSVYFSLLLQVGRNQDVIRLYEELAEISGPWAESIRLYAAEGYYRSTQLEPAADIYHELRTAAPQVATVAFQRLFQIAQDGDDEEAFLAVVSEAEQTLAGRTEVLKDFWLHVGIETYHRERYDLAELYLQRVWDLRRRESISHTVPLYLSELLARREERTRAANVLTEYLSLSQENQDEVLLRLGKLRVEQQDWRRASEALRELVERHPNSEHVSVGLYQYAYALYRLGQLDESLTAVNSAFADGQTGRLLGDFLRLKAQLQRDRGELDDALQALHEFITRDREDLDARVEYITLLFRLERYQRVLSESEQLVSEQAERLALRIDLSVQLDYMMGLAHISLRDYEAASVRLQQLPDNADAFAAAGPGRDFEVIYPYVLYYRGWAHYRLSQYERSTANFARLLSHDERHHFAPRAAYLAGWSAYNRGRYREAEDYLRQLKAMRPGGDLEVEAGFLLGQTLAAQEQYDAALIEYRNVFLDNPDSRYADDSLFEYAGVLTRMNRFDDAVHEYRNLQRRFPHSELAEEAMYRRGELLFERQRYPEARNAFFEHRSIFPQGELVHASLYWGGVAAERAGEHSGALLLWEQLIRAHRESRHRPDAMLRAAEVYEERGEYRNALNIMTEFIAAYPEEAGALQARRKADELILLIGGLSGREATLWVRIDENQRSQTASGRRAILELGRLAILEGAGSPANENLVLQLLEDTAGYAIADAPAAAEATLLLAEYRMRASQPLRAAEGFLEAAQIDPSDHDRAARALFRAAEALQFAGREADAREVVTQLEERFPESEWTARARELFGGRS